MNELLFFDFNQKSATLLIFFFNAIIFSFLLAKKGISEERNDSLWLSLFIFLCGLYISPFMLGYAGWYSINPYKEFLFFTPLQHLFLIGPVLFFYNKSLLNKDFKFLKKHFIHFIPAFLYIIYSLLMFIIDKWILEDFYFYADGRDKDLAFWYQMTGLFSMLFYMVISLKEYQHYIKVAAQETSYADEIVFSWVRNFIVVFGIILILRVLFFILNPEWGQFGSKYWYYLSFSILFFYISITGYSNTLSIRFSFNEEKPLSIDNQEQKVLADLNIWKEKINELINNENLIINPDITLSDVALELDTNRNVVSAIINQGFGMNFNEYINSKRVETVIKKITNGEHLNQTLLSIAMDCGFNSKTTFNRAFKKLTSLTPKQFILRNNL